MRVIRGTSTPARARESRSRLPAAPVPTRSSRRAGWVAIESHHSEENHEMGATARWRRARPRSASTRAATEEPQREQTRATREARPAHRAEGRGADGRLRCSARSSPSSIAARRALPGCGGICVARGQLPPSGPAGARLRSTRRSRRTCSTCQGKEDKRLPHAREAGGRAGPAARAFARPRRSARLTVPRAHARLAAATRHCAACSPRRPARERAVARGRRAGVSARRGPA